VPTKKTTTKSKEKEDAGPSSKTSSLTANNKKATACTQASRRSTMTKRPRKIEMVSREDVQGDSKKGGTSRAKEEVA
jgi:hypothetical protein